MPFRPIETLTGALNNLDKKLTPGPIERFHKTYFENARRRAKAITSPDLIAEIEQLKAGDPARTLIAVLTVIDLISTYEVFLRGQSAESKLGFLAAAVPAAVLIGPHRGTVKFHEREILEAELNQQLGETGA